MNFHLGGAIGYMPTKLGGAIMGKTRELTFYTSLVYFSGII